MLNGILKLGLLLLFSSLCAGQIVSNLWKTDSVGIIKNLNFVSETDLVASSDEGCVTKVNLDRDFLWKRTLIYKSDIEVESSSQHSLLINRQIGQIDVISNSNSQLVWSLKFDVKENESLFKSQIINEKNNFVGILIQSSELKLFNKERIILEVKTKLNEMFVDYTTENSQSSEFEKLLFLSIDAENQLNLYEVNLTKTANKVANLINTFILNENFTKDSRFFLTSSFLMVLNSKGEYLILDHQGNIKTESKLNFDFTTTGYDVEKFTYSNNIVFLNLDKSNVQILSLDKSAITPITIEKEKKEEIYYDKIDSIKKSLIYLFKKKNMNTYIVYDINLLAKNNETKIDIFSKHTLNEDFITKRFMINPYDHNTMLILSEENKIFIISKGQNNFNKIDLSLGGLVFAEIVGYYNDQSQNAKIPNYKSLNQILYQKEFSNIITNLFKNIISDFQELFNKIKNSFSNFNNSEFSIDMTKTKHYLILFTLSEELVILNAFDKSLVTRQQMKNRILYKIIRNTKEDINREENKYISIIFKEKVSENLSALKLNLETAELSDEANVINQLLFEEEIKSQGELLIKDPSTSPLTLTVESKGNNVYGIKYKSSKGKLEMNIAWNINFKNDTTLLSSHFPNIHSNLITTYHVQGKVFYKYIDGNMVLLLSKLDGKNLLVSLVHTSSGKVLNQNLIENVDFTHKINPVFEENLVLISYVKKDKNLVRNEIFTVEMMKREIEHSFINLLEKIFKLSLWGDANPSEYTSESISESDLVFLSQTYILTRKVKEIYTSKSNLNIGNKYLLFLMENNAVFFIDKRIVSPRRPLMKEDKSKGLPPVLDPLNSPYIDPELVPYNPVINFDFKFLLNANAVEDQVNKVLISPTQYESIFLVCTEGINLACYKVFPDKTFDTLNVSFSFSLIGAFMLGIIIFTYLLRKYVKRNEFKNTFLNS